MGRILSTLFRLGISEDVEPVVDSHFILGLGDRKLSVQQSIILAYQFNEILSEGMKQKSLKNHYRQVFLAGEHRISKIKKIGAYKGDIITFEFGDHLCILFEFAFHDFSSTFDKLKDCVVSSERQPLLTYFTRLDVKKYEQQCQDIYYITQISNRI